MTGLGDPEDKIIPITSASAMAEDEVERRRAFAERATRDAPARALEQGMTSEDHDLNDAIVQAEGALYLTDKTCARLRRERPPDVALAVQRLEDAVAARDADRILFAVLVLTRAVAKLLPPDGPQGPRAAEANLGRGGGEGYR